MAETRPDKAFLARLGAVVDRIGRAPDVRERTGISPRMLSRYLKGELYPPTDRLLGLARAAGVSAEWLLSGADPPVGDPPAGPRGAPPAAALEVVGLAECGLRGWYDEYRLSVTTARPAELADPEAFAVMAVGDSLVPRGVLPGYLCICSPATGLGPRALVFVETADGRSSIKEYVREDAEALHLRGWLPPDEAGRQAPYEERIGLASIRRRARVVYLKLVL